MQIKQLSQATGVEVETIRYYEKQGLLPVPPKLKNGYRDYSASHLERLAFVRHCRALDMPLASVALLLGVVDNQGGDCSDVDALVAQQLSRVCARLKSMQALEKQLVQLKSRCDGQHDDEHCGILDELVAAAHGEACACQESVV